MRLLSSALIAGSICLISNNAHAACIYNGALYAQTTVAQEFRDARWVVRAKVLSSRNWVGRNERGTTYTMRLVRSFKGRIPAQFTVSTERNSGGFYLDNSQGRPDVAGDYLLFLKPNPHPVSYPQSARRSAWINYSCGQSTTWQKVTANQIRELVTLASGT